MQNPLDAIKSIELLQAQPGDVLIVCPVKPEVEQVIDARESALRG